MAYLSVIIVVVLTLKAQAQTPSAPAPGPSGPINITGILERGGQYNTFIQFLRETQVGNQINNQVNTSTEGMTVFAPTDNAFTNLPAGTLNRLTNQQQVQLVQYHVLPRYYSLSTLLTVSNPVRTQASGQDGGVFGLNFTGQGSQVNVSTGMVETFVNNALRQSFPLAVYQVDRVLLPLEFYQAKPPGPPPSVNTTNATRPTQDPQAEPPSSASARLNINMGFGLVGAVSLFCMGLFL